MTCMGWDWLVAIFSVNCSDDLNKLSYIILLLSDYCSIIIFIVHKVQKSEREYFRLQHVDQHRSSPQWGQRRGLRGSH